MLLHRYPNIDYIMQKDVIDGILFINEAIKQNEIDHIRQQWTAQLPFMDKETFISFSDYKAKFISEPISQKSDAEILREAREIEQRLKVGDDYST